MEVKIICEQVIIRMRVWATKGLPEQFGRNKVVL